MLNPDNLIHEHIRQSKPDSGLGFQVKALKPFEAVPSSRLPPRLFSQLDPDRCRATSAQTRQPRPHYGLVLSHFPGKSLVSCSFLAWQQKSNTSW